MAEYIEREAAIKAAKHAWAKGLEPSQLRLCPPPTWPRLCIATGKVMIALSIWAQTSMVSQSGVTGSFTFAIIADVGERRL